MSLTGTAINQVDIQVGGVQSFNLANPLTGTVINFGTGTGIVMGSGSGIVMDSGSNITAAQSGTSSIGTLANPFQNVYATNVFVVGSAGAYVHITGDQMSGALTTPTLITTTVIASGNIMAPLVTGNSAFFTNFTGTNISGTTGVISTLNAFTSITTPLITPTTVVATNFTGTNVSGTTAIFQNLTVLNSEFDPTLGVGIITGTTASFTNITGTNLSGTTANIATVNAFVEVTTPLITGTTASFTNITGTNISGTTLTTITQNGLVCHVQVLNPAVLNATSITGTNISGTTLNYQTAVGGVETVNVLNATSITGTTISGTTANIINYTGVNINSTFMTGTACSMLAMNPVTINSVPAPRTRTYITGSSYTVGNNDRFLFCAYTGATTITIPTGLSIDTEITIKDFTGTAAGPFAAITGTVGASGVTGFGIVITGASAGIFFDGALSQTITTNYGSISIYNVTGNSWSII